MKSTMISDATHKRLKAKSKKSKMTMFKIVDQALKDYFKANK